MRNKIRPGFSLFEIVVYMAIVSVFMVSVLTIVVESMSSRIKAMALHTISYQSQFVLNRITSDVRAASDISETDLASNVLTLTMTDGSTHQYQLTSGAITLTVNHGTAEALTSSAVTVDTFTLANRTGYGTQAHDIDVTLALSTSSNTGRPEYNADASLTSTIMTRL